MASRYSIEVPQVSAPLYGREVGAYEVDEYPSDLVLVTDRSRIARRRAVLQLAKYFRQEFRYDFVQYAVAEDSAELCQAFLFLERPWDRSYTWGLAVGACCFRMREWTDAPPGWALQWIWFHPFARGQGRLTQAWPFFEERFGRFYVESPFSHAMEAFLKDKRPEYFVEKATAPEHVERES